MIRRRNAATGRIADPQVALRDRVQGRRVELVELAVVVDQDPGLLRLGCDGVVPDAIVGEVVEDFQRQEPARFQHRRVPVEDAAVDDLHVLCVAAAGGCLGELLGLQRGEVGADFDDFELRVFVHFWIQIADVVQDVQHQRAVARADFVDDQVVVGVVRQLVVYYQVARDGFAVVGSEEFGGRVPELASWVALDGVQLVLERCIALGKQALELGIVLHAVEIERLARVEDGSFFGKVAIAGVV